MAVIIIPKTVNNATAKGGAMAMWTCSKCGTQNKCEFMIKGSGKTDQGVTKKQKEKSEAAAIAQAQKDLAKKIETIAKQAEKRNYHTLGLEAACSQCGNKEIWASYKNPYLLGLIWLIGIVILLIGRAVKSGGMMGVGLICLLGGIAIHVLVSIVIAKKENKISAAMDPANLPTLIIRNFDESGNGTGLLICEPGVPSRELMQNEIEE